MKLVAVTACPVGIAHTYMAAEMLEIAARKLNVEIKVETNGALGIEHELSSDDIEKADAVIIAANVFVEKERFVGKPLMEVSAREAISNAETLIIQAMQGSYPIYLGS